MRTARLVLEPLTVRHAVLLHQGLADERLYRYVPQNPLTLEQLQERYRRLETRQSADGKQTWLNWAIRLKSSAVYAGDLQATLMSGGRAAIAYEVFAAYWRQGLAKEGCAALCHYLFADCQVRVIRANIDTRNTASIGLVEALDFTRVAMLKDADHFKGGSSDEFVYELRPPAHLP